jgi:hypothetical protein
MVNQLRDESVVKRGLWVAEDAGDVAGSRRRFQRLERLNALLP